MIEKKKPSMPCPSPCSCGNELSNYILTLKNYYSVPFRGENQVSEGNLQRVRQWQKVIDVKFEKYRCFYSQSYVLPALLVSQ